MTDAVIVDAVRTPIGKGKPTGALARVHPVDLLAHPLRALVERSHLDPGQIDDVIGGVVTQVGEQSLNLTRRAVLAAGFPERVPATTVDRQCGSSQQAVHFAAQGIQAGAYDIAIACGVESMGRVPMGSSVLGADLEGEAFHARYPEGLVPQGISSELIAARWKLDRAEIDRFALRSQQRAAVARSEGYFAQEIVPMRTAAGEIAHDEGIRASTFEALQSLKPAFYDPTMAARFPQIAWSTTAGNSSQISDGAAAVLLMSDERAARLGLRARARVRAVAVEGDDPLFMLSAIIPATQKLLARAKLSIDDIDLFEVNEAFASVVLAWAKETGAPLDRVNVHGGAIALGHPLGASGTRLLTTLLHALERRGGRYGVQVMCEAGGLANATLIEVLR